MIVGMIGGTIFPPVVPEICLFCNPHEIAIRSETYGIKTSVFRDEFLPYIIKWGRGLNLFSVVLCWPLFGLGYSGNCSSVGWLGCRFWQFSFPPLPPPIFMSPFPTLLFWVSLVPTWRSCPATSPTCASPVPPSPKEAAGVAEGSDEGTIIATIGIAVSIIVNLVILTAGVLAGAYVFELLPKS